LPKKCISAWLIVSTIRQSFSVPKHGRLRSAQHLEDRENLKEIVVDHRMKLHKILTFASQSTMATPRRLPKTPSPAGRNASPNQRNPALEQPKGKQQVESLLKRVGKKIIDKKKDECVSKAKKALQYLRDMKRLDLFAGLHYPAIAEEYAMPANCNVLIGEDQHRGFKDEVCSMNQHGVERELLLRENTRQTVRFVLENAFAHIEPEITQLIQDI
jgi:hypothetical protein